MYRMGHGSARAALIYQHATEQRDLEIARGRTDPARSTSMANRRSRPRPAMLESAA
jgi:hypothetical protein